MPRIEVRDPQNVSYQIVSRNPGTIAAWLMEMAELASGTQGGFYPWNLTVWPLFGSDNKPDWPGPMNVLHQMTPEAFGRLAKWLEAERGIGLHPAPRPAAGDLPAEASQIGTRGAELTGNLPAEQPAPAPWRGSNTASPAQLDGA